MVSLIFISALITAVGITNGKDLAWVCPLSSTSIGPSVVLATTSALSRTSTRMVTSLS